MEKYFGTSWADAYVTWHEQNNVAQTLEFELILSYVHVHVTIRDRDDKLFSIFVFSYAFTLF